MLTLSKYHISNEEEALFNLVLRKRAYWDFVDEYENGEYEGFDPTDEEIEKILDNYLANRGSDVELSDELDDMRAAIDSVRRRKYDIEVHYLAYDMITVWDVSEKEAHEQAKTRVETLLNGRMDGFIEVTACGTSAIDGVEIPESWDHSEHATRWE